MATLTSPISTKTSNETVRQICQIDNLLSDNSGCIVLSDTLRLGFLSYGGMKNLEINDVQELSHLLSVTKRTPVRYQRQFPLCIPSIRQSPSMLLKGKT
jgi:hypothetical protein